MPYFGCLLHQSLIYLWNFSYNDGHNNHDGNNKGRVLLIFNYSGTSYKQPPFMSGLGGLSGKVSLFNSNLTDGGINWDFG